MKQIFTKTQAVSVLVQIKNGKEINIFESVDPKHSLFSQTCEQLEEKLLKHIRSEQIAGVVDDPTPL